MDIATFIGIFSAFGLVALAISSGGGIGLFVNLPSLMIVVGGTVGATMINYPIKEVIGAFKVGKNAFLTPSKKHHALSSQFIDFSVKARREGILALESHLQDLKNPFLEKGIQLSVDGLEPEIIRSIMDKEVDIMRQRHQIGAEIFSTMGGFAPALGMIGTLVGLVKMLQSMSDPNSIGPAMAIALLTTFYGSVLANLIFMPIAGKLKTRSKEEARDMEMVITGVLAIANGDNPRILEQKLMVFFPPEKRISQFK